MRLTDHLDKISWSVADKFLFVGYGLVTIFQFEAMAPEQMGLFGLLFGIFSWIFIISDSFALQPIIQFGAKAEQRSFVNTISMLLHILITLGVSFILYLLKSPISSVFSEPRLVDVFTFLPLLALFSIPRTYALKIFYRDAKMNNVFFSNLAYFGVMSAMTFFYIFTKSYIDFYDIVTLNIAGNTVSSLLSTLLIKSDLKFTLQGNIKISGIVKFSTSYTLTSAIHLTPRQLDMYVIQYFFSTSVTGIYFLAKNLFRAFEEIVNAANGLVYPAAVRQLAKDNRAEIVEMTTKAVSFLIFFNLFTVIALNLGLTDILIKLFLSEKYYSAIPMFNILSFVAIGLPFTAYGGTIIAYGRPNVTLKLMTVAACFWLVSYYAIGKIGNQDLVAVPHIIYYLVLSILLSNYVNKHFGFSYKMLLRFFPDAAHFIKKMLHR